MQNRDATMTHIPEQINYFSVNASQGKIVVLPFLFLFNTIDILINLCPKRTHDELL